VVSAVGGKAEETVVGLPWVLSSGTAPFAGTWPSDVWAISGALVCSLGLLLFWSLVLALTWLVATASVVAEVLEISDSLTMLVLIVFEYAVSAPVSVGTALGNVELGAAGSVVGCA
jgi:hypothetical protein